MRGFVKRHCRRLMPTMAAICVLAVPLTVTACGSGGGGDGRPLVGLITKTNTNPFFVTMKEGAEQAAAAADVELQTFAGRADGDNESQVLAIENLISAGAAGFLITPNDSKAIVPAIDKAKEAGMLVIALDTPTDPADAVDATFATDNYQAGLLIGRWARATFAAQNKQAKIAMLDLNPNQISVDVQRDQGFLEGFGIDVKDKTTIGDETDPRIVGHAVTDGAAAGGRTAMENLLLKNPAVNLVYTINEPAAAGAYQALKAAGRADDVTIVSVDGGCPGVDNVAGGVIGATSMQFPLEMAKRGVAAIAEYAKTGTGPAVTAGESVVDTGVTLITDRPQPGIESKDSAWGKQNCWG